VFVPENRRESASWERWLTSAVERGLNGDIARSARLPFFDQNAPLPEG
jgi:hypothetical protein